MEGRRQFVRCRPTRDETVERDRWKDESVIIVLSEMTDVAAVFYPLNTEANHLYLFYIITSSLSLFTSQKVRKTIIVFYHNSLVTFPSPSRTHPHTYPHKAFLHPSLPPSHPPRLLSPPSYSALHTFTRDMKIVGAYSGAAHLCRTAEAALSTCTAQSYLEC